MATTGARLSPIVAGDINFNIDKLPESPWFWLLVAVAVWVGLLVAGKVATAFLVLALVLGGICLLANVAGSSPSNTLWGVVIVCLLLVLFLGLFVVPSEWQPEATRQVVPALPPAARNIGI